MGEKGLNLRENGVFLKNVVLVFYLDAVLAFYLKKGNTGLKLPGKAEKRFWDGPVPSIRQVSFYAPIFLKLVPSYGGPEIPYRSSVKKPLTEVAYKCPISNTGGNQQVAGVFSENETPLPLITAITTSIRNCKPAGRFPGFP